MTRKVIIFSALMALQLTASQTRGQSKENILPRVARLFIGSWEGSGKSPDGDPFKSELIFGWTLGRNFIEVTNMIEANGKREKFATTFYGWQPVLGHLVFWSFDKEGTINEGQAALDSTTLKHEWRSFSKGGEIRDWRSKLSYLNENNLRFVVLTEENQEMFSVEYKRKE